MEGSFLIRAYGIGYGSSREEAGMCGLSDGSVSVDHACYGYVSGSKGYNFPKEFFEEHTLEDFIAKANKEMDWKGCFDSYLQSSENLPRYLKK